MPAERVTLKRRNGRALVLDVAQAHQLLKLCLLRLFGRDVTVLRQVLTLLTQDRYSTLGDIPLTETLEAIAALTEGKRAELAASLAARGLPIPWNTPVAEKELEL